MYIGASYLNCLLSFQIKRALLNTVSKQSRLLLLLTSVFFSLSLDASVEDKSLGRLVNDDHIKPNCKIKAIDVGGMPHLCLFALRDIAPGEEITYNYGDSDWPWRRQVQFV